MIKISHKIEDYKIYVQDDKSSYIQSDDIIASKNAITGRIKFNVHLANLSNLNSPNFNLSLIQQELKSLIELLQEVYKQL